MPQPGFEPGFLRPQRTVLTTRLLRQLLSFEAKLLGFVVSSLRLDPLVKQIGFLFGTMVGGFRVTTAGLSYIKPHGDEFLDFRTSKVFQVITRNL